MHTRQAVTMDQPAPSPAPARRGRLVGADHAIADVIGSCSMTTGVAPTKTWCSTTSLRTSGAVRPAATAGRQTGFDLSTSTSPGCRRPRPGRRRARPRRRIRHRLRPSARRRRYRRPCSHAPTGRFPAHRREETRQILTARCTVAAPVAAAGGAPGTLEGSRCAGDRIRSGVDE
ncbi:hypothetical protein ACU686_37380 [Yinghuangia aomiensis]